MKMDKKAPCKVVIMTLPGAGVKEWKRVYWNVNIKKGYPINRIAFFNCHAVKAWRRRLLFRRRKAYLL